VLELSGGGLTLGLLPEAGGVMVWLRADGLDLLRPADPTRAAADPTWAACFPLVPYSGPVVGGSFRFGGAAHGLAPTHPDEPEPIHGEGWRAVWEIVAQAAASAVLRYRHAPGPGTFPFPYLAEQHVALSAQRLSVGLMLENIGSGPMPAGIGLHPYFPDRQGLVLGLAADGVWSRAPLTRGAPPTGPPPAAWRFAPPRSAAGLEVDDCFTGWGGRALLEWPRRGVGVELTAGVPFDLVQLYATAAGDFLCVEPVSNANDGLNLLAAGVPGHGVRVLAPGERMTGEVRLSVR
jgi:aldose 1-epimerase